MLIQFKDRWKFSVCGPLKAKLALNIRSHLCLILFQVMRTILDLLPQNPEVKQVMVDFEKAMWNCLREVLPDVTVKGCVFHWTQALWRKVS